MHKTWCLLLTFIVLSQQLWPEISCSLTLIAFLFDFKERIIDFINRNFLNKVVAGGNFVPQALQKNRHYIDWVTFLTLRQSIVRKVVW